MRRVMGIVAVFLLLTCLGFAPLRSTVGRAAAEDELSRGAMSAIDHSLILFCGDVTELGPAPGKRGEGSQWVAYRNVRVIKGACAEDQLVVEHSVSWHPNPDGPGLDPRFFAKGQRLVMGVELHRESAPPAYTLEATYGPIELSDKKAEAVVKYANPSMALPTATNEKRQICVNNLSQLAQVYLMQAQENRGKAQKYSGVALWLSYRKSCTEIKRGDERVLLCPADTAALLPKTEAERKLFDDVDLSNPRPGLCSYAGRDFVRCPLPESDKPQPVGACLHHPGGAVVVTNFGDAKFLTLKELGLDSEADKIVGPDSKSPLLRVLR